MFLSNLRVGFCDSSTNKQCEILFKCRGLNGRKGDLGIGFIFLFSCYWGQVGFART